MKSYLLTVLFIGSLSVSMSAQSIIAQNASPISSSDLIMNKSSDKIDGSPYFNDNNDLVEGLLYIGNDQKASYYMRYNILQKRIEFSEKADGSNLMALPLDPGMIVQIGSDRFQYLDFSSDNNDLVGYFKIVKAYDENNLILIKYTKDMIVPDEKARSSYSSNSKTRIIDLKDFYFVENGKINEIQNHKKRSLRSLDDSKEDMLKKYIKDNNIDFDDEGLSLARLITYYRTLK